VNLTLKFILCALELSKTLTDTTRQFGKFLGPEKKQHNHENKNDFRPTWHPEREEWRVHEIIDTP
jgi:hypothetical protein